LSAANDDIRLGAQTHVEGFTESQVKLIGLRLI